MPRSQRPRSAKVVDEALDHLREGLDVSLLPSGEALAEVLTSSRRFLLEAAPAAGGQHERGPPAPRPFAVASDLDDPEMDAHELVVHQQHSKVGAFEHFGTTISFSDAPGRIWGPPPVCGQHTRAIMREHGFEDAEVDKLIDARAVFEEHWVE